MEENNPLHFPQEMIDMFAEIAKQQEAQVRQCKTMLAGFKATGETDLDYMDSYMDCLHDFMEQSGDVESLYLEYIGHIATFNPLEAKERKEDLEESLGYKTEIAYAAAYVARNICRAEKGTEGDEFFKSHCWRVGSHLIQLTKEKLTEWMREPKNDFWRYDFDEEELMPFAGEKCIPPSEEEWNELIDALNLLNEKTAKDKNSYLSRFKDKYLPIKVKIEDLEHQPSRKEEHHLFLQMLWDYVDKQEHDQLMNGD